jgi:hypothetical protein
MPGIQNSYSLPADVLFTSNVVLASLNLGGTGGFPIAANQKLKVRYWVKATVGATGGLRAQIVVPAGGTSFQSTIALFNTVAPSVTPAAQQSSAAFTNALANAGTHWLEIEAFIQNGATAGKVDLQMAQNTSDVLTLTVLKGASLDLQII